MKFKIKKFRRENGIDYWDHIGRHEVIFSGYGDNAVAKIGYTSLTSVFSVAMNEEYIEISGFRREPPDYTYEYWMVRCFKR